MRLAQSRLVAPPLPPELASLRDDPKLGPLVRHMGELGRFMAENLQKTSPVDEEIVINQSGAAVVRGDVLALRATAATVDKAVTIADTVANQRQYVVALDDAANNHALRVGTGGVLDSVKVSGVIARGDYLRKSATASAMESTGVQVGSPPPLGTLAHALGANAAGTARIPAYLFNGFYGDVPDGSITAAKILDGTIGVGELANDFPFTWAWNSVSQTLTTGVDTLLTYDSEVVDVDGMHSTSVNTSRLTAVRRGYYLIQSQVTFAANATGDRYAYHILNNATLISLATQKPLAGVLASMVQPWTIYPLAVGDFVETHAVQNSGGNLAVSRVNNYSSFFMAVWLRPFP